ncbi:MAG: ABC-type transport auxiliary lipoprotein family protein [Rhodoferax sp.]
MKDAMTSIAATAYSTGARSLFVIIFVALAGCSLPYRPVRSAVYDFGPGTLTTPAANPAAQLAPLAIADIEANPALDNTAVMYRLAYTDAQLLHPYAQARWSMTPAQLVRQRLREHLGQHRALLNPTDGVNRSAATAAPTGQQPPRTLRIELEEFSQLFESPTQSVGLLRLRATLTQPGPTGDMLVAQRSVTVQQPATSADAQGGVRALTAATDAAMREIELWLAGLGA